MPMTIKQGDAYHLNDMAASGFSPRECQVLLMRAQGASVKAIAAVFNCSCGNVNNLLKNLFYKTGANNSTELITKAMQSGKLKFLSLFAALFIAGQPVVDHQYIARHTRAPRTQITRQVRQRDEVLV